MRAFAHPLAPVDQQPVGARHQRQVHRQPARTAGRALLRRPQLLRDKPQVALPQRDHFLRETHDMDEVFESEREGWSLQGVRPANQPRARLRQYRAARDAVWRGAQKRNDYAKFKSVYSIIVSRVDI